MTLLEVLDDVRDTFSDAPQEKIVRAVNDIVRDIYAEITVPQYSTFTTKAKTNTGTVSVTNNSTTATFSASVVLAADPIRIVQIEGSQAWYGLTRNAADTAGVLSSAFDGVTDTTATYTILYPAVSFPVGVGEILRIWREGIDDGGLAFAGDRGSDMDFAQLAVVGSPIRWSPYIHDSAAASPNDDLLRILLTPTPEAVETFMYAYRSRPTKLTTGGATSQTIPLPDGWDRVVKAGVMARMYEIRKGLDVALPKYNFYARLKKEQRGNLLPAAKISPRTRTRHLRAFSPNPSYP